MLTLSLANWMELPGLKLKEWLREKRRSVSQYLSVSPPVHLSVCVSFFSFFKFILKCFTDRGYLINLCQSTQQMISNGFSALSLLVRYGVLGSCWGVLGGFYSVLGDTSQVWGKKHTLKQKGSELPSMEKNKRSEAPSARHKKTCNIG